MLDKAKITDLLVHATKIILKAKDQKNIERGNGNSLNFMTATGIQDKEIRHSAFLAALLDPDGDHVQEGALLGPVDNHLAAIMPAARFQFAI